MAINFLNTVAVDDSVLFVDTINDRVGIGTDSPDYLLDLYKSTATTSSSTGTTLQRLWNYVGSDLNQQKTFVDFVFQDDNDNEYPQVRIGAEVGQNGDSNTQPKEGSGAFVVYTNNATGNGPGAPTGLAERFRVDYRGNVGIGTTSPETKLQVEGSIQANAQGRFKGWYTSGSGLALETGVSGGNGYILTYNRDTSAYSSTIIESTGIQFVTHSSGKFYFTGGDVGIGTTSPSEKLEVAGSVRIGNMKFEPTDAGRIGFNRNTTNGVIYNSNYPAHQINAASSTNDFFEIQSYNTAGVFQGSVAINAGKVGIGTTSPSEKLEVDGNIKIKDALLSNQENTDIDSAAAEVVAQVAHATYTAAFFDFVVKKGTNVRSGTVYACHNGDSTPLVEFTETSTNDLGDTSDVTLSVDISGANMRLVATVTSDDWSVKSLIRAI